LKVIASVSPTTLPLSSRTFMRMTKLFLLAALIGNLPRPVGILDAGGS
jgi:hypothetical protein